MNTHHTKLKGDIGLTATIHDLTVKGYFVFVSISENCNYDLVADDGTNVYRVQSKYRGEKNKGLNRKSTWSDKNGNHIKIYPDDAFDFYSIYLKELDKVIYVPFNCVTGTINIRTELPNSPTPFYWWEDFIALNRKSPSKRTLSSFGIILTKRKSWNKGKDCINTRKVIRPSKEELEKIVWQQPTSTLSKQFGVSDVAISKWCKSYGITKPPRGYWTKKTS